MHFWELDLSHPSLTIDLIALILGLSVGSFLNVVALRSLAEESIVWPPSRCPRCQHRLGILDNIPLLSWLLLRGRCRYCAGPISWQYPVVEAFTGLTFVAVERTFLDFPHSVFNIAYWNRILSSFLPQAQQAILDYGTVSGGKPWDFKIPGAVLPPNNFGSDLLPGGILTAGGYLQPVIAWPLIIGALFFACTLIAVTITDFREKLIPHEITYPSMIIGILFSALVRHDALGAMAGIGASYILFDFIAFYGLKVYLMMHGGSEEPVRSRRLRRRLPPRKRRRMSSSRLRWRLDLATIEKDEASEPMEVMGGGDAVLSAVLSAYLGWQLLVIALVIGFLAGTVMGMGLLIREMEKAKLLHKCAQRSAIAAIVCATAFGLCGFFLQQTMGGLQTGEMVGSMAFLGGLGGALLGVVSVGTRVSKPYPFGPALALGGFIAMFLLPNWLSLH